ncbi:MAG: ABC transporter substrate-binding protein, partial [Thiotrichales bacterium]|nr:ABC transporter substrate-binding protein [Thiotrichales bacterium]
MILMFFVQLSYGSSNEKEGAAKKHLEATPVTVQLNWNHQYEFAGFYAALAKDYYADVGLDVSLLKWQPDHEPLQRVLNGQADFGVGYSTLVVDYVKGMPIEILSASFQYSPMILLSKTPVMTLEDLKHKRVMTHDDMQIEALLSLAYQAQVHEIQVVKSTGDLSDFINDEVELYSAYATNEPYRLDKMGIAYYPVDPKNYGIQSYGNLLFTSSALARKNPNLARRFNEATLKGWEYALYNQSEIVDYILANFPVVKTREELLYEAKETVKYVKFGSSPIGQVEVAKLQAIAVNAVETGLISEAALKQADISKLLFRDRTGFLTLEELSYLQQHPVISLANDNAWAPFEFTDEEARYQGLAADYFKLFEQKLGVRFEATANQNWESALQRAYTGELP